MDPTLIITELEPPSSSTVGSIAGNEIEIDGLESPKIVKWEDLQQELARLWSLSSALNNAKEQKSSLTQRLEALIMVSEKSLKQSNELEEMREKVEARKLAMGDTLMTTKGMMEDVKSQRKPLGATVRMLLVAGKALRAAQQQLQSIWVEKKTGYKGFILYPCNLSISGGDDRSQWIWHKAAEVPNLLDVCKLEVVGKIDMSELTAGETYQAAFIMMLKDRAEGWDSPITLRLDLPDGTTKSHDMVLKDMPRDQWMMTVVGTFMATGAKGEITYSMLETTKLNRKTGLAIKSSVLRPVFY